MLLFIAQRARSFSILLTLGCFLIAPAIGAAQGIEWIRQFGTSRRDEGTAVAKGPSGAYVTGNTIGIFEGQTAAGPNDTDVFLTRFDESGQPLWSRQFGSAAVAFDSGMGVATVRSFPHFVNGEGWSTQFVLYSGTAGQASSGTVKFHKQDGASLPVTLR